MNCSFLRFSYTLLLLGSSETCRYGNAEGFLDCSELVSFSLAAFALCGCTSFSHREFLNEVFPVALYDGTNWTRSNSRHPSRGDIVFARVVGTVDTNPLVVGVTVFTVRVRIRHQLNHAAMFGAQRLLHRRRCGG